MIVLARESAGTREVAGDDLGDGLKIGGDVCSGKEVFAARCTRAIDGGAGDDVCGHIGDCHETSCWIVCVVSIRSSR